MTDERSHTRKRWLIPLFIILISFLGFSLYQWIIPRTDLEIRTVYHESPAGGGTGGSINVNVLLTNWGNREISRLDAMVTVMDNDGLEVARNFVVDATLDRGSNIELKSSFIGSQYKQYDIRINVEFFCSGSDHEGSIIHSTWEDQMNIVFVENIG